METMEGARYTFWRSGLLNIAKMTRKFKMVPGMLTNAPKVPNVIDSFSDSIKLSGSVTLDVGIEGSHLNQQLPWFPDGLIFIGTLT
jgi:hypothetical protein